MPTFKEKIHTIDNEIVVQITLPKFFHIGKVEAPEFHQAGDHVHYCYEYIYILKGRGKYWINEREFESADRTVYFLMPGQHHRELSTRPPFAFYHLKFYLRDLKGNHVLLLPVSGSEERQIFPDPESECLEFFSRIFTEASGQKPWRREIVESLCMNLTAWTKRKIGLKPDPTDEFAGKADKIVNMAKGHIGFNLTKNIDLKSLSRSCGISPDYLGHIFKKVTGISPMQHLSSVRIDESKRLLRNPDLSLEEIARRSGFSDIFYFSRKFKQKEGISPSIYRKKILFRK